MTTSVEAERNHALLDWYAAHGRDLPWRRTSDPYAILLSEMMLQQTQVDRVTPFYQRFVEAWPTVDALAAAPLADVLAAWSGLGYNSRAKRLLDAARKIAEIGWPTTATGLAELPGVGPYTAAAVAAFSFGERAAAVDTNAKRVLSRWHGDILRGAALDAVAAGDIAEDAASWNQAVMDLGATVCTVRRPSCDVCPVSAWCAGPEIYEAPRQQSRFEGSLRQVRGALVRKLVTGTFDVDELADSTGFAVTSVEAALDGLVGDGLVRATEEGFTLAE